MPFKSSCHSQKIKTLAAALLIAVAAVDTGWISVGKFTAGAATVEEELQNAKAQGITFSADNKTLFRCPKNVTSVVIPSCVTSISDCAFDGCRSLISVTIPDSVFFIGREAFYGCSSLTSVTIPDSVTTIEKGTFSGCSSLTSVTLPAGVTRIGYGAFFGCSGLMNVIVPAGCPPVDNVFPNTCRVIWVERELRDAKAQGITFSDDNKSLIRCPTSVTSVIIPSCVTTIGDRAFQDCSHLTSVVIPGSVTAIGEWAFLRCTNLESVTIPDSVTSIGALAFSDVKSVVVDANNPNFKVDASGALIDIVQKRILYFPPDFSGSYTIPDSVTTIDFGAFSRCRNLTSVTIHASVTAIGEFAFSKVKEVKVADGNEKFMIGEHGALLDLQQKKLLYLPPDFSGSYIIPAGVTSIGKYAFFGIGLTSVTIPDGVTAIAEGTFLHCYSLTSVTIPDSVTAIGASAFSMCDSLTSVTVSAGCRIADDAFSDGCQVIRR